MREGDAAASGPASNGAGPEGRGPALSTLRIDYFNFEHGGRPDADYHGNSSGGFDFSGLVREVSRGDGWPDVLALGEADRYGDNGYEGALEAAAAMREAGGPPYVAFVGSLPGEGGPFGPAFFLDSRKVVPRRWYDNRLEDFAARNRNVLLATLPGRDDWFRLVVWHGHIHDPEARLAEAKTFDRFANPKIPTLIAGDWNTVPSGPHWEPHDLNDPGLYEPWALGIRIRWVDGRDWTRPRKPDTRALDFLVGWWDPAQGRRVGGIGYYDIAELEGVTTGTYIGGPPGRHVPAFDRMLVNAAWRDRLVPGSYRVYQPADLDHPSDHLRISVIVEV